MHFYEFIKTLPKQPDAFVNDVVTLIKNDDKFPAHTSDPSQLAMYLYLKLNHKQTSAFQKLLMLYQTTVRTHRFPDRTTARPDMLLDALNLIVSLQNHDSHYPFH